MTLQTTFNAAIEPHIQVNGRLVLGLSGGIDSRVLLELMASYARNQSVNCLAVHVDHGLSVNAKRWAERCQQWCKLLSVPFLLESVSVERQGKSLEESAREARYAALAKHIHHNDLLITGQHADDQLETILLALKRGSGPKGLAAMAPMMAFAGGKIVRPLLSVSRADIVCYAKRQQLEWIDDESNQDTRFDRNFIRHRITPELTQRWPHIQQTALRTAELCSEQEQLLDELLAEPLRKAMHSDGSLKVDTLMKVSDKVRTRLLRMWLELSGLRMPSRDQLMLIWQQVAVAQPDANPQLQLEQAQIRRFQQRLFVVRQWQSLEEWQQSIGINRPTQLPDNLGVLNIRQAQAGNMSLSALNQAELRIVFNPQGLSAHPSGRGHSRKLKKLFQEYDVPSWLRRRIPIILSGEHVVAVGDLFIDRHFIGQDCELVWDKSAGFV